MKKIFKVMFILPIFSFLFSSCSCFNNIKFSELKTGENFLLSGDGYYKKLPYNYCINVNLRSTASLFRVSNEYANTDWDSSLHYDNIIVDGHFIKGFYTSQYLILCEEKDNDNLEYIIFDFSNEQIQQLAEIDEIYQLLNIDSIQWFTLCNTNKEIQSIK